MARAGKSATELEFDAAYHADPTKILVLLKEAETTDEQQRQLIDRVCDYGRGYWTTKYRAAADLSELVLTSFECWIDERVALGSHQTYVDRFISMADQRRPDPDAAVRYALAPTHLELDYTVFGIDHEIHLQKSQVYDDFWGRLHFLDEQFGIRRSSPGT